MTLATTTQDVRRIGGQTNILAVQGGEGARANSWHTDVTFVVAPPKATTLRSLVIPPYGGDTLFANTAAAYADLPEHLRLLADRLWAVHTNDHDYAEHPQFRTSEVETYHQVFVSQRYRTAHPVVRIHPESGTPNLFIGGFADTVIGLSRTESKDILRLLQSYVTRPENTLRHRWAVGDVVIFDNRTTQHYAADDYGDLPRKLHRVTVAGDLPVGADGGKSYVLEGDEAGHYTPRAAR
jgi:alpha-ketoglutarate-dependent taurine dioxygenase